MPTEAGEGEHNYYLLKLEREGQDDGMPLQARRHYLGIDAVRWFVNEQGSWRRDKMASSTTQVSLANETYEVGLGTYQLKGGERTAPVFDRPILPNRVYLGGQLRFQVFVRAVAQNTLLGDLLQDMAKASLNVVSGAVAAATATGPMTVLLAAGSSIVGGTRKILNEAEKGVTVFDPSGVDVTLEPSDLQGRETYLLIHRGMSLDRSLLTLTSDEGGAFEVLYDETPLDDGAWVLFRLRREERYGSPRPWEEEIRQIRTNLNSLIDMWSFGGITRERAQAMLTPKRSDPPSLGDKVLDLVTRIRRDFVLTETEATRRAGELRSDLKLAQEAVKENESSVYHDRRDEMTRALDAGNEPPRGLGAAKNQLPGLIASGRLSRSSSWSV